MILIYRCACDYFNVLFAEVTVLLPGRNLCFQRDFSLPENLAELLTVNTRLFCRGKAVLKQIMWGWFFHLHWSVSKKIYFWWNAVKWCMVEFYQSSAEVLSRVPFLLCSAHQWAPAGCDWSLPPCLERLQGFRLGSWWAEAVVQVLQRVVWTWAYLNWRLGYHVDFRLKRR